MCSLTVIPFNVFRFIVYLVITLSGEYFELTYFVFQKIITEFIILKPIARQTIALIINIPSICNITTELV